MCFNKIITLSGVKYMAYIKYKPYIREEVYLIIDRLDSSESDITAINFKDIKELESYLGNKNLSIGATDKGKGRASDDNYAQWRAEDEARDLGLAEAKKAEAAEAKGKGRASDDNYAQWRAEDEARDLGLAEAKKAEAAKVKEAKAKAAKAEQKVAEYEANAKAEAAAKDSAAYKAIGTADYLEKAAASDKAAVIAALKAKAAEQAAAKAAYAEADKAINNNFYITNEDDNYQSFYTAKDKRLLQQQLRQYLYPGETAGESSRMAEERYIQSQNIHSAVPDLWPPEAAGGHPKGSELYNSDDNDFNIKRAILESLQQYKKPSLLRQGTGELGPQVGEFTPQTKENALSSGGTLPPQEEMSEGGSHRVEYNLSRPPGHLAAQAPASTKIIGDDSIFKNNLTSPSGLKVKSLNESSILDSLLWLGANHKYNYNFNSTVAVNMVRISDSAVYPRTLTQTPALTTAGSSSNPQGEATGLSSSFAEVGAAADTGGNSVDYSNLFNDLDYMVSIDLNQHPLQDELIDPIISRESNSSTSYNIVPEAYMGVDDPLLLDLYRGTNDPTSLPGAEESGSGSGETQLLNNSNSSALDNNSFIPEDESIVDFYTYYENLQENDGFSFLNGDLSSYLNEEEDTPGTAYPLQPLLGNQNRTDYSTYDSPAAGAPTVTTDSAVARAALPVTTDSPYSPEGHLGWTDDDSYSSDSDLSVNQGSNNENYATVEGRSPARARVAGSAQDNILLSLKDDFMLKDDIESIKPKLNEIKDRDYKKYLKSSNLNFNGETFKHFLLESFKQEEENRINSKQGGPSAGAGRSEAGSTLLQREDDIISTNPGGEVDDSIISRNPKKGNIRKYTLKNFNDTFSTVKSSMPRRLNYFNISDKIIDEFKKKLLEFIPSIKENLLTEYKSGTKDLQEICEQSKILINKFGNKYLKNNHLPGYFKFRVANNLKDEKINLILDWLKAIGVAFCMLKLQPKERNLFYIDVYLLAADVSLNKDIAIESVYLMLESLSKKFNFKLKRIKYKHIWDNKANTTAMELNKLLLNFSNIINNRIENFTGDFDLHLDKKICFMCLKQDLNNLITSIIKFKKLTKDEFIIILDSLIKINTNYSYNINSQEIQYTEQLILICLNGIVDNIIKNSEIIERIPRRSRKVIEYNKEILRKKNPQKPGEKADTYRKRIKNLEYCNYKRSLNTNNSIIQNQDAAGTRAVITPNITELDQVEMNVFRLLSAINSPESNLDSSNELENQPHTLPASNLEATTADTEIDISSDESELSSIESDGFDEINSPSDWEPVRKKRKTK
jgi:hypothetical protein